MQKRLSAFLRLFLPIVGLIVLGSVLLIDVGKKSALSELKAQEKLRVGLAAGNLQRNLQQLERDLQFLAGQNAVLALARDQKSPEIDRLQLDFINFLRAKPIYDQVRWINAQGQEIVRVDQHQGRPSLIPQAQLQNKADRPYVTETLRLKPGETYFSPLDLNIENGEIERPFKPTLRLATPVVDAEGHAQGLVILNYLADDALKLFASPGNTPIMLLNEEAYWLYGAPPADLWGFMFNDPSKTLSQRYPPSWTSIQHSREGQFTDENGLWTLTSLSPQDLPKLNQQNGLASDSANEQKGPRWKIVAHVPTSRLQTSVEEPNTLQLAFALGLLGLFGLGAWRIVTAGINAAASDERLELLSNNLPKSYLYQYTCEADGAQQFLFISSGVTAVHGLTPEAVVKDGSLLYSLTDPSFLPAMLQAQAESKEKLSDFRMEIRARRRDGDWGWLELRSRPRLTSSGKTIWDGVATDISEAYEQRSNLKKMAMRADALLALPHLEEQYEEREFMQQVLDLTEQLTSSEIGFMHFVNADNDSIELMAWSSNTLKNHCKAVFDSHYPLSQAGIWADAARQRRPVTINDYASAQNKRGLPDGHSTLLRLISVPVMKDGEVRMMTGVGNKPGDYDQTDIETVQLLSNEVWRIVTQRRTEKALRIASQVVNASPVICFRWRAETGWPVVFVSDNITQWGYSTADMMAGHPSFSEMIHPDDLQRVVDEVVGYTANGLNTYLQEYRLRTADDRILWVEDRTIVQRDATGKVVFYDGVLNDMTERKNRQETMSQALTAQRQLNKRLEEAHNQLLQSEKMASIGQLAAGIAHELNNPIGFVHSNMGTLEGYLRDMMDIIDAYESYTNSLGEESPPHVKIEQLKDERDFKYLREDIFSLLNESKDGLGRVRKIVQDLKNFSRVGEQEWQLADLHQGLDSTLNIVWNELKYKCTVKKEYGDIPWVHCLISQLNQVFMNLLVNAGQAIETQGQITIRTALHGEDSVQIEIIDTGQGIDAEHLDRIFEPFFTTKPVGKGTGLGLSLSYGIIERHRGRIEVDSEPGKGSCFRVIIPIEQATTASQAVSTETAP